MVPRVAPGLLALLVLFSGCSANFLKSKDGFADWQPIACDPTKQDLRTFVRAKDPSPSGDMNALAQRFGDALGDPVLAKTPTTNADGRSEWRTTHGSLLSRHDIDPNTLLEYQARRAWPGLDPVAGRAALETFAASFGFRGERIVNYTSKEAGLFDGKVQQTLDGRVVGSLPTIVTYVERGTAEGAFVRVTLRPFYVLPEADRVVDDVKVLAIAQSFMRCKLDELDRTHERGYQHRYTGLLFDWLPIHNKSVAYVVQSQFHNPMGGSCPSEKSEGSVYLDAWTGTVLAWDWNRCGKTAA